MDDKKNKNDLEEEMSRFEQEIANQLPPPPQPPMAVGFAAEDQGELDQHGNDSFSEYPPSRDHNIPAPIARFPQNDHQRMLHPFPQLPHLPPLPPLPHGMPVPPSLQLPSGNHPMPGNLPQFIPPPMPPLLMNPVPISRASAPVIKPPTVPIDSYDPTEALEEKKDAGPSGIDGEGGEKDKKDRKRKFVRVGGGQTWEDESLSEWDNNDFRLFCGDLGNEVTDEYLYRAFSKYASIIKAKVVRDRKTKKTKGFGFVSFKDPQDYLKAMREMNGKYVGNRPIKLRKSTWKDRNIEISRKKDREKKKLGLR